MAHSLFHSIGYKCFNSLPPACLGLLGVEHSSHLDIRYPTAQQLLIVPYFSNPPELFVADSKMFTFSATSAAPRPADPLEAPKMLDPGPKMELLLEASPKSIKEELLADCVEPPSQHDSTATGPFYMD